MAVKKILRNAFEQILETGKGSAKQVVETLSPWEMIQNNLNRSETHEQKNKKENSTSLDLKKLQKEYENQDEKKIKQMSDRLFNIVNRDSQQVSREKDSNKLSQERNQIHLTSEKRKEEQDKQRRLANSEIPKGRERGFFGKKKRRGSEPAPIELRPASSKQ